jgi:uncharacterized protein YkwD
MPALRICAGVALVTAVLIFVGIGQAKPRSEVSGFAYGRDDFAPVTQVSPTTYGATAEAVLYEHMNAARLGAGAGLLTQSEELDTAARAHLGYLRANYPYLSHDEVAGHRGFTGLRPADRALAAGYGGHVGEVLARLGSSEVEDCAAKLLNSVYHQAMLLAPFRDIGVAYGELAPGAFACVMVLGLTNTARAMKADPGVVKAYPFDRQANVALAFAPHQEVPNPLPDMGRLLTGPPILASMDGYGANRREGFAIERFVLRDEQGREVPGRVLAHPATVAKSSAAGVYEDDARTLRPGDVYFVPLVPLHPGTTYSVDFRGLNGAQPYIKAWTFTTTD